MNAELRKVLLSGIANRQTIIHFPNGEYPDITEGIYSGSMKLEEILCAEEEMVLGECNASRFEATISGIDDISNLMIYVYQRIEADKSKRRILTTYDGTPIITYNGEYIFVDRIDDYVLPLFYGRVDTAVLQTDRIHRVITAYDELYFNGDINCAEWYASFFAGNGAKTLKVFRDSLFSFIGIEQETIQLVNDSVVLEETMETTALKFADVIKAICQINGCFGHIDRNGVFRYVHLGKQQYLINHDGTPLITYKGEKLLVSNRIAANNEYDVSDNYRSNESEFESYTVKKIDKLQISGEEGDIGAIVGTGNNPYVIQGNFLVWGKSAKELNAIATRIFNIIKDIEYRPYSINLIYSEPYITVGDTISLTTKRDGVKVNSYVLRNYLSFAQLFHQNLEAEGSEYKSEVVDDVNAEINQLRGKTLKIVKTVEEYSVRLDDLQVGYSEIKQTVDAISLRVSDLNENYSEISLAVDNITSRVSNVEGDMSLIEQSVNKVTIAVEDKVDVGTVTSQLNIEPEEIAITGDRFVVNSTNLTISANKSATSFLDNVLIVHGDFGGITFSTKITPGTVLLDSVDGQNKTNIYSSYIELKSMSSNAELNASYLTINDGGDTGVDIEINSMVYEYGGTTMLEFTNTTGDLTIAGNLYCTKVMEDSDIRLKKDFTPFDTRFEDFFLKLKPMLFKMIKDESGGFRSGLIAQEVIQAFEDSKIDYTQQAFVKQKDDGYYALNYNYILNLAIHMIQQLYKRMEALENETKQ